ncbi:hypothetical protein [Halomonas sp. Mc5H-6]|uniref:hypothetical protein n=1 Tax=Halomonas sp. Mc5H-6 TaxID=2954500 RepID=UPI0020980951|nr:hypothetical protein [Halomonas sp. Mc5H-6]MCO7248063.1 hypothetical protein [Halomonas sp. Mc5H-6]
MILTRDQLARLTAILAPYRGETLTRPTLELALALAKSPSSDNSEQAPCFRERMMKAYDILRAENAEVSK